MKYLLLYACIALLLCACASELKPQEPLAPQAETPQLVNVPQAVRCSDGTVQGECSQEQPKFCDGGGLVDRASLCGYPEGFRALKEACQPIPKCNDGTYSGECSKNKPYFCQAGLLISDPDQCGCPLEEHIDGSKCVSIYLEDPKGVLLKYVLRGSEGWMNFTVYGGYNDYFSQLPRKGSYDSIIRDYITDDKQRGLLAPLVEMLRKKSKEPDDQARIAISLIQYLPYDTLKALHEITDRKYPYEVLYTKKGVCNEKSWLGAALLEQLGFGVAIFDFRDINHEALGIQCEDHGFAGTGYCFVEMTTQSIITDDGAKYIKYVDGVQSSEYGVIDPTNVSVVYQSKGSSFNADEEFNDSQTLKRIMDVADRNGYVIGETDYKIYRSIVYKYRFP